MGTVDPIAAWQAWKQDKGDMTLQEAMDLFEDGQVVDARTAAALMVLSAVIIEFSPTTRLQEVS